MSESSGFPKMENRMKKLRLAVLAGLALLAAPLAPAQAAGVWETWVGIGASAYCASTVTGVTLPVAQNAYGVVPGSTQGTGMSLCGQTVPPGPLVFAGTEYIPADIGPLGSTGNGGGASSAVVSLLQLGQGPMIDLTTVGTAQTIPNGTPFYFLDGAQAAALTVTMPAAAVEGQIQHVTCEAATVGALTVAANTGQTVKGNPAAACTAGVGYNWRYQASNTTWYRF
jgi:hypothetical protein